MSLTPENIVTLRRGEIIEVARRHGANSVRVFGSAARGEARADSDLDLLVQLEPGRSLLDLIGLQQELERMLERHVDVVTEAAMSPYIRDEVLRQAVAI